MRKITKASYWNQIQLDPPLAWTDSVCLASFPWAWAETVSCLFTQCWAWRHCHFFSSFLQFFISTWPPPQIFFSRATGEEWEASRGWGSLFHMTEWKYKRKQNATPVGFPLNQLGKLNRKLVGEWSLHTKLYFLTWQRKSVTFAQWWKGLLV